MDLAHFGLTRRPFRPTPDTDAYYPAPSHEFALAALRGALAGREGLALVDGDPGCGKTLVALKFLEGLDPTTPRVMVPAPRFARPADLLQALLFDLGVAYQGLTEQELRLAVTDHLLGTLAAGGPAVVVIDEAQHLGSDILEEVRLLGNLETRSAKAAFVVLAAQPGLRERLTRPELAPFAQRIAVRCHIEPLTTEESAAYLRHQVHGAGGRADDLLTEDAVALLAARCKGLPRLLNQTAALAFSLAGSAGEKAVDAEAAIESLARLGLADEGPAVLPHPARKAKAQRAKLPKRRSA
jgi:type II secretory pathway predicted ATPase ExeA